MKKYETIVNDISIKVNSGLLRENDQLMTEQQMEKFYSCSRITVRKALEILQDKGLIRTKKGSGSFILKSPPLLNQKSYISVILPDNNEELRKLFNGIEEILSSKQIDIHFYISHLNPATEAEYIKKSVNSGAIGIILFPIDENQNKELYTTLLLRNFPLVFIDRGITNYPCNLVTTDSFSGMLKSVEYLIQAGNKHFIYATAGTNIVLRHRYNGFLLALQHNKILFDKSCLIYLSKEVSTPNPNLSVIERTLDKLKFTVQPHTAIVCANDNIAYLIQDYLKKKGLRSPNDYAICGFDNSVISHQYNTKLTTVAQDFYKIGQTAASLLLEILNTAEPIIKTCYIAPKLIIRESTLS